MTPTWDCTDARPSLGVYVLGAIDPAERSLVDAHLTTCRDCRDELAGLAGLPALLARVNPDEVSRICADDTVRTVTGDRPPGELIGTVLDLAAARRRRTRWRFLATAAAVVAIAGGLYGGLSSMGTTRTVVVPVSAGQGSWETVQATSSLTAATASIAYSQQLWGNAFEVLVNHIPVGTTCQLWVVHPDGTRTQVAAWTTSRDEGKVWYAGSMASTAAADQQLPDHGEPPGAADRDAHLKPCLTTTPTSRPAELPPPAVRPPQHQPVPPLGMDDGLRVLCIGVTGGLIALAVTLVTASVLGLALRRRAGRFRAGPGLRPSSSRAPAGMHRRRCPAIVSPAIVRTPAPGRTC